MSEFYISLFAALTAFVLCYKIIPVIIEVAAAKKLFDQPDHRKQHTDPIPPLGGVGIIISLAFAFFFWADSSQVSELRFGFIGILIIFFMGLKDDLLEMAALKKLMIQITMAGLAVFGGFRITHFHNLFGFEALPPGLQYGLSILAIVGLANAFNLIDGIDGLSGGLSAICFLCLGVLFIGLGLHIYCILAFAAFGATLAFLKYNFSPAKIFMGDAGSLSLGFLIALMCIKLLQTTAVLSDFVPISSLFISFVFSLIIIPVVDVSQVMTHRILQGRSPFKPDRGHLHHLMLRLGLSHRQAALVLWANTLLFFVFCLGAYYLNYSPTLTLIGIMVYAYVAVIGLHFRERLKADKEQLQEEKEIAHPSYA